MNLIKRLPVILASLHAIFTSIIFGMAIKSPEKSGLLPLLVYYLDYPFSIVINWVRHVPARDWSITARLGFDWLIFFVLGSAWFYLLGLIVRGLASKLHGKQGALPIAAR